MARVRDAVGGRRAFVKDESAFVRRAAAFERFLVDAEFAPTADERLFVLREIRALRRSAVGERGIVRHIDKLFDVNG